MPTQRLSMRRISEVLRLKHQGLTERVIAHVGSEQWRRAWLCAARTPCGQATAEGLDDEGLELLLFPAPKAASQSDRRPPPDWVYMEKELRRLSVTRLLLWEYHLLKILFFPGRDVPSSTIQSRCLTGQGTCFGTRLPRAV
jgi:hypothetical protein